MKTPMTYCPQYTLTILINKKVGSQKTNEMQKKIVPRNEVVDVGSNAQIWIVEMGQKL